MTTDPHAELEEALAPLRAARPGITNQEAAPLLPEHLREQLWERAIDRHMEAELAKPRRPTEVTTVTTLLCPERPPGITSVEAAAGQSHAMANADGEVFYPDSAEDAAWFAREHGARAIDLDMFPFKEGK